MHISCPAIMTDHGVKWMANGRLLFSSLVCILHLGLVRYCTLNFVHWKVSFHDNTPEWLSCTCTMRYSVAWQYVWWLVTLPLVCAPRPPGTVISGDCQGSEFASQRQYLKRGWYHWEFLVSSPSWSRSVFPSRSSWSPCRSNKQRSRRGPRGGSASWRPE